jgi:hypothetical protein
MECKAGHQEHTVCGLVPQAATITNPTHKSEWKNQKTDTRNKIEYMQISPRNSVGGGT